MRSRAEMTEGAGTMLACTDVEKPGPARGGFLLARCRPSVGLVSPTVSGGVASRADGDGYVLQLSAAGGRFVEDLAEVERHMRLAVATMWPVWFGGEDLTRTWHSVLRVQGGVELRAERPIDGALRVAIRVRGVWVGRRRYGLCYDVSPLP
jgi:hypothetical protein